MATTARLLQEPLNVAEALAGFTQARNSDGAVVSFTGLVRSADDSGAAISALTLEWYPGLTERSIADIARDAESSFAVSEVLILHRVGRLEPGEPIVLAAAAATHRRAAFQAVEYLMDRLKSDAAFWKREEGAFGARWVEPRPSDQTDRARWSF